MPAHCKYCICIVIERVHISHLLIFAFFYFFSCKELTRAKKQLTIHTLPNVLTIQLKRWVDGCGLQAELSLHYRLVHFRFEFNTLFGGKINKIVQYPEYLNMRPFMSDKEVRLLYMYIQYYCIMTTGSTLQSNGDFM